MQYKLTYDPAVYKFKTLVANLFEVEDLSSLHTTIGSAYVAPDGITGLGNDTHSRYHKMFYDKIRSGWPEFTNAYTRFIKNEVAPLLKDDNEVIYQALPSFRIQYPTGKAVTTWHCDNDDRHKHPIGELNILLPLTEMKNENAVWAESLPGLGDYSPMNCQHGEFILWNGNRCRHGNKPNTTGVTRVSLDFRIIPKAYYNEEYAATTATTKMRFRVGEYYSITKD